MTEAELTAAEVSEAVAGWRSVLRAILKPVRTHRRLARLAKTAPIP